MLVGIIKYSWDKSRCVTTSDRLVEFMSATATERVVSHRKDGGDAHRRWAAHWTACETGAEGDGSLNASTPMCIYDLHIGITRIFQIMSCPATGRFGSLSLGLLFKHITTSHSGSWLKGVTRGGV